MTCVISAEMPNPKINDFLGRFSAGYAQRFSFI
jgi:hypothetical protein